MSVAEYHLHESTCASSRAPDIAERVLTRLRRAYRQEDATGLPWTTLTYAQSLDGCIAASGHKALRLSNELSMRMTHQLRDFHEAVLVGINTILSDDPRLTVRLVEGRSPQPVVLDRQLRFPLSARLLREPCISPVIACGPDACQQKAEQLTRAGAQVVRIADGLDGMLDLAELLRQLKRMELHSVMVEGGARVISSFLANRLADEVVITISPQFVGGVRAVEPGQAGPRVPRLDHVQYFQLDDDLIVCGAVAQPSSSLPVTSRVRSAD
jgi:3,4-dihydroxy 2-butanone 4-phosphate synthase/GTP cyclohydrolase II